MTEIETLTAALAGRYEIAREIGSGGMATVYLARDVRHDRKVALKVLRPELGAVLGVERFLAEIKVTANLQHPNLLPLFDSGEAAGLLFYVMPFVEGESLRARLDREKQLPVDEAVRIAVAVASALEYAHEHGVIHRDLKPDNILLQSGQPVLADFGIALAVANAGGSRITQTGLSLGTPQYMSPEQATGDRVIDGRTDIYSLGAVLYEMLVGDPPHAGSTAQAVIAKLLTEPAKSVALARASVPAYVDFAVGRALAKLPADRWTSARAFGEALQGHGGAVEASAAAAVARSARASSASKSSLTFARPWAVALVVAVLFGAWGWLRRPARPAEDVVRFALQPSTGQRLAFPYFGNGAPVAISPDGKNVVYSATASVGTQLYLQSTAALRPKALPGTNGAVFAEFSPDGKWLAFGSGDFKIRKLSLEGGGSTTIAEPGNAFAGLTWISNESIVFGRREYAANGLWRVSAAGGDPTRFSKPDSAAGDKIQWMPRAADGGRLVFYTSSAGGLADTHIAVTVAATGKSVVLRNLSGTFALGLLDNWLLYVRDDGTVMAARFDKGSLRAENPVMVQDSVAVAVNLAAAAVSATGALAYVHSGGMSQVMSVDEHGLARALVEEKRAYAHPRLSPDGTRIAFDVGRTQGTDIWVYDLRSRAFDRITTVGVSDRPEWTPDGRKLLYSSNRKNSQYSLWWQPVDGSAPAEQLVVSEHIVREGVVTPDGQAIVYREDTPATNRDVFLLSLKGDRTPVPLLTSVADELMPRVSPDGKWLVYISDESGRYEVYARALTGSGRVTVSAGGGMEPLWSPDGHRVFYRDGMKLMVATITTAPSLAVTGHQLLFEGDFDAHPYHANYDLSHDGKSFIMLKSADDERKLVVVLNWLQELRKKTGETRGGQ